MVFAPDAQPFAIDQVRRKTTASGRTLECARRGEVSEAIRSHAHEGFGGLSGAALLVSTHSPAALASPLLGSSMVRAVSLLASTEGAGPPPESSKNLRLEGVWGRIYRNEGLRTARRPIARTREMEGGGIGPFGPNVR